MSDYGVVTEPGTVRLERLLPGPIERVWAYLTESDKRAQWFAGGEIDLRPGGNGELVFKHSELSHEKIAPEPYRQYEGLKVEIQIIRCEPPRVLSYTGGQGKEGSEVTFELTPRGDEVLLVITERRLPDRAAVVGNAAGWHAHADILADLLNGREPRGFWSNHARVSAEYEERFET
jgi:uncharacterized protein YndB with AHSA1/START domain